MSTVTTINFIDEYEYLLEFISKKYKIDLNELKINLLKIPRNTISDINYDISRCKAYVIKAKEKNKNQCTRQLKIDGFCNLHYNLHSESKLKFGYIKIQPKKLLVTTTEDKTSDLASNTNIEKKASVQRILIDGIEYKINPLTSFVYDFHSNTYLGKLDSDYNIIKEYKS